MSRVSVIQSFINCFSQANYLEVGVERAHTFHPIQAARKVAVDPIFRFDLPDNLISNELEYHQVPSDDYFASRGSAEAKFDVIFLDGLHTFEQTLRDLLNAVECLADNGVIVIDDIWPTSYAASLPDAEDVIRVRTASPDDSHAWMGDIYRLVYFVSTFMQSYRFASIDNNPWQLVMWRGVRSTVEQRQLRDIAEMSYAQLLDQTDGMNFMPFDKILAAYQADHHPQARPVVSVA